MVKIAVRRNTKKIRSFKPYLFYFPVHHPDHGYPVHAHEDHRDRPTTNNEDNNVDGFGTSRGHDEAEQEDDPGEERQYLRREALSEKKNIFKQPF